MASKPSVLVLGGCGFIGRHLVDYLITNNLVSNIRIVDKTPSQMAWLNARHTEIFKNPCIEFKSANLINATSCENAFMNPPNDEWTYVFNCAGETKLGQSDPVYEEGIYKLSLNCAREAVKYNVQRYVELSSGNVNSSDKIAHKENDKTDPWTFVAKYKLKVEKDLETIPNLKYTILRLPIVYGVSDRKGLTPRIITAALYRTMHETMKLLWTESMKLNTIHVSDVTGAAWYLATNENAIGQIYNVVDDSDSTQGSLSDILADIFNINVDYFGVVMSKMATLTDINDTIEHINDKLMAPWAEMCMIDKVENTPLTPYMDTEFLYHKHLYLDNTKFKSTGYVLQVPKVTKEKIQDIIIDFIEHGLFPSSMGSSM